MRFPGLLLAFLALLAPSPRLNAQGPAAEAPARTRELLRRLDGALAPLRLEAYGEKDRRPVAGILAELRVQAAALRPPPGARPPDRAEALRRLERSVGEALAEEESFWRAFPAGRAPERFPAATAEPLKRRAAELSAVFAELFPESAVPGAAALPADAPIRARPDQADRVASQGKAATADPRLFYDGGATGPGGPLVPGGAATNDLSGRRSSARSLLTGPARSHPSDLALGPVPAPAPVAETGRPGVLAVAAPSARAALRSAAGSAPYAGRVAVAAVTRGPPAGKPALTASESACREASGGGMIAGLCGSRATAWSAPMAAGLLDAAKEQFGTVSGVVSLLAFTVLGILLSVLSGGVGLLASLIKAVCGIALVWTALSMLRRIGSALATYLSTRDDDPRRWRALREIGKVGGELIILMMMAFVGYKIGQKPAVKDGVASMTQSLKGTMSRLGLRPAAPPPEVAAALGPPAPAPSRGPATGSRSNLTPPEPPPPAPSGLKPPNARHRAARVDQGSVAKTVNTVAEPWVPMNEHVRIIAMGEGSHTVNGKVFRVESITGPGGPMFRLIETGPAPKVWRYGVHDTSFHPVDGPGLHVLSRGAFKALGTLNTLGPERAGPILTRMGISEADRGLALQVWRQLNPTAGAR